MVITTTNGTAIELYDDTRKIPRAVYHQLQKYAVQTGQMTGNLRGSTVEALRLLERKELDDLKTKLENLMLAIYAIEEGHSFEDMEWGSLVKTVNGQPFVFSEDAVKKLIEESEIEDYTLVSSLEDIKKKSQDS